MNDNGEPRLRPVDLARAAGISPQQVRNHEAAGVLPRTGRTPSGYRVYTDRHRRALLAYRALARGHGIELAQRVMHAVHAGDVPVALALIDSGHAALHQQRVSLQATSDALEAIVDRQTPAAPVPREGLRIGEVAARLGVRTSALRVWESAGLVRPEREPITGYRRYGPADVRDARLVHLLRQTRHPLPQVRAVLDELRRTGTGDAVRAAIAQRQADLTGRATAMLEGSGRLHDYITDPAP
ncbi:MerR family transcriptional regulator [Spirillospora sp. CA-142024]|uniref:MerR family transcriptional regulator n=1 Tax=Spirillospora sp. CA-142024 TaxID=3240036 RepID=UPI003D8B1F34